MNLIDANYKLCYNESIKKRKEVLSMRFYYNHYTKEIYTKDQYNQMKQEYISENLRNMPFTQWSYNRLNLEDPYGEWPDEIREAMRHEYIDEILEDITAKLSKAFDQDYCLILSEKPIKAIEI